VITVDAVDAAGNAPDGTEVTDLTATPGLVDEAFQLAEGEDSGFKDTPDGDFYVARVDSITPARVKGFDEVRDQVLDDWRTQQIAQRLSDMANDAAAQINEGASLPSVAASLGRDVRETPRAIKRGDSSEIFTNSLLNTLFTEAAGTAAAGRVPLGGSYVVAEVTEVIPADPEADADQVSALKTALEDRIAAELINSYVDDAENSLNVQINEQALSQVVSNLR
jgi:peptidyl-prolyl cis-trans isomerase D